MEHTRKDGKSLVINAVVNLLLSGKIVIGTDRYLLT